MCMKFGIFNYKHSIIFLSPFIYSTKKFFVKNKEKRNSFYADFINFLSLIFCGSLHLISTILSKSEKEQNKKLPDKKKELNSLNENKTNNSLKAQLIESMKIEIEERKKKIKKISQIFFIIFLSSLQMAGEIIQKISLKHVNQKFNNNLLVILELFFFIIFSMIFLNFTLYLHQYAALGLFLACHIIFLFYTLYYKNNNDDNDDNDDITIINFYKSFLYIFSYEKLYCLLNVLGKKYLNLFNDSVYLFLFKIGIIGLPPLLIYDAIANLCDFSEEYHGIFHTIFHDFEFWKFLRDLIYSMMVDIGIWLTIYYFSPCHYIILDILYNFLAIIIDYIKNEDDKYTKEEKITFLIFYPILIFDVLVFNEFIILKFLGLSKNTRLSLMERESLEHKSSEEINDSRDESEVDSDF